MSTARHVSIELEPPPGSTGRRTPAATVRLSVLPGTDLEATPSPLVDRRGDPELDASVEPVQVLEGKEYRYELEIDGDPGPVVTDRPEVFRPDADDGRTGRFRPGLHTGTIAVTVSAGARALGRFAVEVRSRKLDYLAHYRWMLRDLAEILSEIVMQRFAASEQTFQIDEQRDAPTLYQRFVFLQSLLRDDHLRGALHHIAARPYITWETEREARSIRRGLRGSSDAVRQLTRPGPRVPWSAGPSRLESIPRRVYSARTYSTVDNDPNRFVQFALRRWHDVVSHIRRVLEAESRPSAPVRRGAREARALEESLERLLHRELFRTVGELSHFPASNQVLQKRAGYRAIYRTYIQFELASKLSWDLDDVYGAGQRDVATLYEYWVFLQLVEVVVDLCDESFDLSSLFTVRDDGLSIGLEHGTWQAFDGVATALGGRQMQLELHFNRRFGRHDGSWTRTMRPDCSIRIQPVDAPADTHEEIWVHFDAKYRVHEVTQIFDEDDPAVEVTSDALPMGRAKGADLLKMHAYRDAIRRSAGAYVLYPGTVSETLREYHELLPGLGAFPLVPTDTGMASGAHSIRGFIRDILDHSASQLTQHERGRYWTAESYRPDPQVEPLPVPTAPFLPRPPADTLVLLGYVKSDAHRRWIHDRGIYNLRADPSRDGSVHIGSRELAADLAVLYGPDRDYAEIFAIGEGVESMRREELEERGYADPRGEQYFVLPVEEVEARRWRRILTCASIDAIVADLEPHRALRAPRVVSWSRLVRELDDRSLL